MSYFSCEAALIQNPKPNKGERGSLAHRWLQVDAHRSRKAAQTQAATSNQHEEVKRAVKYRTVDFSCSQHVKHKTGHHAAPTQAAKGNVWKVKIV